MSKKSVARGRPRPEQRSSDERFMALAISEASKGVGRTSPNPAVGAAIVKGDRLISIGFHKKAGEDHAEVVALEKAGVAARDATLYCTLEPCVHFGRTPPCTQAIIEAGIRRVVIGTLDPNPRVKGKGIRQLQAAGVEVERDVLGQQCQALNEPFNYAIVERRPFVVLKAATSLDGRIATRLGHSQWITSEASRRRGHALRSALDAVVVGVGTVLADDPQLTARIARGHNPVRVVLDSKLRTPVDSQLVKTAAKVPLIIATTRASAPEQRRRLEARGAEVLVLKKARGGRVDLEALLGALHARGLNGILVEGGAEVHGAFVDAQLVNKVVLFLAPMLIGGQSAKSAIGGQGARRLPDALALEDLEVTPIGSDLMLTAYVRRGKR